eukprot:6210707-Pleurochrysis_carterae.AAC.3
MVVATCDRNGDARASLNALSMTKYEGLRTQNEGQQKPTINGMGLSYTRRDKPMRFKYKMELDSALLLKGLSEAC